LLQAELLPRDTYAAAHGGLVICCHDVLIEQDGAYLLIRRKNHPAKDILWPIGGRVLRGVPAEQSLRQRVKGECQLDLGELRFLGTVRTLFHTEPFGHGRGTDTLNLMYVATGHGILHLDDLHETPTWIRPGDYTDALRQSLHPYVQDMMDAALGIRA
jgi:ADP-ribose pyrophosphatase YjhB (NUDIX family)